MEPSFIHLRLHSEFSLVDGLVRIKPLVKQAAAAGMPAVALTDLTNLYGLVKFYQAATGAGLKPLCGADFLLAGPTPDSPNSELCLLVQDGTGYKNLIELISRAYLNGQRGGRALIERDWVRECNAGLICLSGGQRGDVGQALRHGKRDQAARLLAGWQADFGDRYYLEVQRTRREGDEDYLHAAVDLAAEAQCPVVATNDVRFLTPDEYEAHEARVCIHEGRTLDDPRRERRYSPEQYLKTPAEMAELFSDLPEALANSVEIAKRCNLDMQLGTYFLPEYPIPEGMTTESYFEQLAFEGLDQRFAQLFAADDPEREQHQSEYRERLRFELDIINQMGFPGYFLIVMDFIRWAKQNGIPVGPGRGSGAGSLVAYALEITDLDPIAYDLLFERFLNPERVSMPDFDVDFCMDNRDRVIQYVAETYGRDAVSQIITFGTMAAKAVVRDVARVQGKSYGLADKLAKLIPFEVGMTLDKAHEQEEPLREFLQQDDEAQDIWEMALQLEGVTRNVGKHAGGVVIAPTKLTDFAPLYCDENGDGVVTQFDKDDVEQAGLVKFDFLGLRTLTIIDWAVKMINAQRAKAGEAPLDITAIPLNDSATYDMLQKAETTAVFQLESRGMKDLIKRLKPNRFEDIIALVALFRPGPLQSGMVDDFINRKHGRAEVAYPHPKYQHPDLKPVLEPTYGIILYQEQVMQIAQVIGGYTLGGADLLRRAMGKKKVEEMAKQRQIFLEGAQGRGVSEELATNLFDLMEKFAGYGFNKSHSAAYALVSYQTAWLKAHYPAPFMAAVMSSDMQNTDKVVTFIEECRAMGLSLLPPDVNQGAYQFTVDDAGNIIYGLGAIKGLGEGPIDNIIAAREAGGPFTDLFDFCARIDPRKVNKRALEALIRSGALDRIAPKVGELGYSRAVLFAAINDAVKAAEQSAQNADAGMADLFGEVVPQASDQGDVYAEFRQIRPWTMHDRLQGEKDTLGLYLTGHPIDEFEHEVAAIASHRIADLKPGRETQRIAGLVVAMRVMKNKRGDTMAFVTLDDRTARIEVTLFADSFNQYRDLLQKDALLVVDGQISHDDYSGSLKMRGNAIQQLQQARRELARRLWLALDQQQFNGQWNGELARRLAGILGPYKQGHCPVHIQIIRTDARGEWILNGDWKVVPDDELLAQLRDLVGRDQVRLEY